MIAVVQRGDLIPVLHMSLTRQNHTTSSWLVMSMERLAQKSLTTCLWAAKLQPHYEKVQVGIIKYRIIVYNLM